MFVQPIRLCLLIQYRNSSILASHIVMGIFKCLYKMSCGLSIVSVVDKMSINKYFGHYLIYSRIIMKNLAHYAKGNNICPK